MRSLEPDEQRLEGQWLKVAGRAVADDTCQRIETLISTELAKVATSHGGWDVLYVDQRDGRRWELTYPHKEWHGGGPPMLTRVSESYARSKYNL